jgi:hypothetical protein
MTPQLLQNLLRYHEIVPDVTTVAAALERRAKAEADEARRNPFLPYRLLRFLLAQWGNLEGYPSEVVAEIRERSAKAATRDREGKRRERQDNEKYRTHGGE